ncbi:MAG: hypothetical protein NWE89_01320 [Candidatus Bathyarchaeota archaeon]|nr:hypothetical protein [Candidatus Bathyarchaeota archaeon]
MYIKDEYYIEKRNRENLVETHRKELHKIIKGHNCVDVIHLRVLQRLTRVSE